MSKPASGSSPHIVECEAPFSFYFQLVEPYWKAKSCDSSPLHRLATLARKQGARALVIEDAATAPHVQQEIATLDAAIGGGGGFTEALRLSFLSEVPQNHDINSISDGSLIGQCTLINHREAGAAEFGSSFVFEAFFATPTIKPDETLLNNFINCEATFRVEVDGRPFAIRGLYYAQQNGITSVCAHACIRMAVRTLLPDQPPPSTARINELIGDFSPTEGMLPDQIESVLKALTDLEVVVVPCSAPAASDPSDREDGAAGDPPKSITPAEYVSVLTSAADSGDVALLSFETGAASVPDGETASTTTPTPPANHVVVTYGYTFNSDEWHPQAMPEYSGKATEKHSPASAWVDHFVIHDDNFGPYLALSSRALEKEVAVQADWIIIVRRLRTNLEAHAAEAAAAIIWAQTADAFADGAAGNNWLRFLLAYTKPLVTRPVLLTRDEYCDHLATTVAHDGSKATKGSIRTLREGLPPTLWMIELTLPDLLTGNHSKLGEVLLDANDDGGMTLSKKRVSGIRVPSRVLAGGSAGGPHNLRSFPITSHSPLYQRNPRPKVW